MSVSNLIKDLAILGIEKGSQGVTVDELGATGGAELIGNGGESVKDSLDALQLPDYAALRAYNGPRKSVYVTGAGIAGMFVRDDGDTTSADNGGTVIVADGKRWKRAFDGAVNVRWFGAKGDGVTDDTALLEVAGIYCAESHKALLFPDDSEYGFTNISCMVPGGLFDFAGNPRLVQLPARAAGTNAFEIGGGAVAVTSLAATAAAATNSANLADASDVQVGDLVRLQSTRLMFGDHRFDPANSFSQLVKVTKKVGSTISFADPLVFDMAVSVLASGTAQAGASGQITLAASASVTRNQVKNYKLRITGGAGAGQERFVHEYNPTTKVVDIGTTYTGFPQADWSTIPDATSTYQIVAEVSVTVYRPATVRNLPITIKGYAESGVVVRGVQVSFCDAPKISGAKISGCSNNGLYTYRCYMPEVSGNWFDSANYVTDSGGGLGYGHMDIGGYAAKVHGNRAKNCRTGFDAIGGSLFAHRFGNTVIGGGKTYDLNDFWPNGTRENSGMSTHTGAYGVTDESNTIIDCALNKQRGLALEFNRNTLRGRFMKGCAAAYTDNVRYIDNTYDDGFVYRPSHDFLGTDGILTSTADSKRMESLIEIRQSTLVDNASIIVKGSVVKGVTQSLVMIVNPTIQSQLHLSITDNDVDAVGIGTLTLSVCKAHAGDLSLREFVAYNNRLAVGGTGLGGIVGDNFNKYPFLSQIPLNGKAYQIGASQWLCLLNDDQAAQMVIGVGFSVCRVDVYERDYAVPNVFSAIVRAGSTTAVAQFANSGVNQNNGALTGTAGTDGVLNLGVRTDGRAMLENRTGTPGRFIVSMSGVQT